MPEMLVKVLRDSPVYHLSRSVPGLSVFQAVEEMPLLVACPAHYLLWDLLSAPAGNEKVHPPADLYPWLELFLMQAASGEVCRQKYSQSRRGTRPPGFLVRS